MRSSTLPVFVIVAVSSAAHAAPLHIPACANSQQACGGHGPEMTSRPAHIPPPIVPSLNLIPLGFRRFDSDSFHSHTTGDDRSGPASASNRMRRKNVSKRGKKAKQSKSTGSTIKQVLSSLGGGFAENIGDALPAIVSYLTPSAPPPPPPPAPVAPAPPAPAAPAPPTPPSNSSAPAPSASPAGAPGPGPSPAAAHARRDLVELLVRDLEESGAVSIPKIPWSKIPWKKIANGVGRGISVVAPFVPAFLPSPGQQAAPPPPPPPAPTPAAAPANGTQPTAAPSRRDLVELLLRNVEESGAIDWSKVAHSLGGGLPSLVPLIPALFPPKSQPAPPPPPPAPVPATAPASGTQPSAGPGRRGFMGVWNPPTPPQFPGLHITGHPVQPVQPVSSSPSARPAPFGHLPYLIKPQQIASYTKRDLVEVLARAVDDMESGALSDGVKAGLKLVGQILPSVVGIIPSFIPQRTQAQAPAQRRGEVELMELISRAFSNKDESGASVSNGGAEPHDLRLVLQNMMGPGPEILPPHGHTQPAVQQRFDDEFGELLRRFMVDDGPLVM